jgi:hypothetical protein
MDFREFCELVQATYPRLHPHLYDLHDEYFDPSLLWTIRTGEPDALRGALREVHPQVFTFDMLRPRFCRELLEEAAHFEAWCRDQELPPTRPNTMNNYGVVLDIFGFATMLQRLMTEYVAPFAELVYADVGGGSLDTHHGFIVEYAVGKDTLLDFHVDASDVTLNVCLGKEFTGGTLYFRGIRCALHQETAPRPEEEFESCHVPGRAILHRGKHRHGANPIEGGHRYNLILWCNSTAFDRRHDPRRCPDWCGWPEREAPRPGQPLGGRGR